MGRITGIALLCALVGTIYGQNTITKTEEGCCANYLMDSTGLAVVEWKTPVTSERKTATKLKVKFCAKEPVWIQLWAPAQGPTANNKAFEMVWQIYANPSTDLQTSGLWSEINIGGSIDIEPNYRLGLHNPTANKIPIPYRSIPDKQPPLFQTEMNNKPTEAPFTKNQVYLFNNVPWTRSFLPFVKFCTETACVDGTDPYVDIVAGPPGAPGPAGPAGPQGPPGPAGVPCYYPGGGDNGNGDGVLLPPNFNCDSTDDVKRTLNQLGEKTGKIEEALKNVDDVLNKVANTNFLTGTCPRGFISGSYGLGFCYILINTTSLSFGEAAMQCHETYDALPVYVESSLEEGFIVSQILKGMSADKNFESYWTSGLFSPKLRRWVWFDEKLAVRKAMSYTNWGPAQPAVDGINTCMIQKVFKNKEFYWEAADCRSAHYFICKRPKNCY